MFIDLTMKVTPEILQAMSIKQSNGLKGHVGTHFDVMDKEFPLDFIEMPGVVFDVSSVGNRYIDCNDIDLSLVGKKMFISFYTGFIESCGYGNKRYFKEHPELSNELLDTLLSKDVSIIGIDFAGVRRGVEHKKKDQLFADNNKFIVENMCNLKSVLGDNMSANFTANTYPINYTGMTGLPCRVVAKI